MSPYKVLGVPEGADVETVKAAYRKLVKQYHPDVNPRGEAKFKEITAAYEALTQAGAGQSTQQSMADAFRQAFDGLFQDIHAQNQKTMEDYYKANTGRGYGSPPVVDFSYDLLLTDDEIKRLKHHKKLSGIIELVINGIKYTVQINMRAS